MITTGYSPSIPGIIHADAHQLPFPDRDFDLVVCSNVLEHLRDPQTALIEMRRVASKLWLSWTPWYSPFGGHTLFPFHYFGKDILLGNDLFKTFVSETLNQMTRAHWTIDTIRPRYWPRLASLAKWKYTREWATWNVEVICH